MRVLSSFTSLAYLFKSDSNSNGNSGATTGSSTHKPLSSYYYSSDSYLAPRHIFWQIITLQLIYYSLGFLLILFTCIVAGRPPFSPKLVFSWTPVRYDTTLGWTLVLVWLLVTISSVIALTVVVGRSKLALDFTLTLHGINLIVCWIVDGSFPTSGLWWGLQFTSIVLMVSLGTWTSQWRELRNTFFDNVGLDSGSRRVPSHPDEEAFIGSTADAIPETALLNQYNEYELEEVDPVPRKSTSSLKSETMDTIGGTSAHSTPKKSIEEVKGSKSSRHLTDEDDDGDLANLLK